MSFPAFPQKPGWAWRLLFWPLSFLYGLIVRARTLAYRQGWVEVVRLPVPVLCVGNVTVGGSGKTPGVIWLAEYLRAKGRKPAVITRGYGGRGGKGVRVVSDGKGAVLPVDQAGDEPFLMARRLPWAPIVAGADRAAAGRVAWEDLGADVLVMDDGYQHLRLFRNLNLLCVDAGEAASLLRTGGACLLPAGRLREPLSALWRADTVFLTRAELPGREALSRVRKEWEEALLDVPVVPVRGSVSIHDRLTGDVRDEAVLRGRSVLAVSGLAQPESFEEALRRRGMGVEAWRFPDHHFFTPAEQERIQARARREDRLVVVTEKDEVRLPAGFPCLVARLEWSPEEGDAPEKGDTTAAPRRTPWTRRLDAVLGL